MKQADRRNQSTEKLIRAYLELAAEQGVSSITFDAIGERAGYSRGLAFSKFGSKDGLLEAVINFLHDEVARARDEAHAEALSGLEALILFCSMHLAPEGNNPELRAYFVLMSSAVAEQSDMAKYFVASHKRAEEALISIIGRGQADGSLRSDIDVRQTALLIGTQLIGISTQSIIDPDFDKQAIFEALRNQIVDAYGTDKGRAQVRRRVSDLVLS